MALQVIGTGLSRTGTLTLKVALERLGFGPCYHAFEFAGLASHTTLWHEALDQSDQADQADQSVQSPRFDWERIFAGYRSTVDVPGVRFWRELIAAYPDARVILTERDPDQWHASLLATLRGARTRHAEPGPTRVPRERWALVERTLAGIFPMDRLGDKAAFVAAYHRHTESVRAAVPADRLLRFQVTEGWEPLARFLDADIPDEPFPRVNAGDSVFANVVLAATRDTPTATGLSWT